MGVVRIITFDGGGTRGPIATYSARELEKDIGPLARHAHFIAGSSTGGLIATGLSEIDGKPLMSAHDLHTMYMRDSESIFDDSLGFIFQRALTYPEGGVLSLENAGKTLERLGSKIKRGNGYLFGPQYNPEVLQNVVSGIVGDRTLSDVDNNLILTSYTDDRDTRVYKSWKAIGAPWAMYEPGEQPADFDAYLLDILMSTTAAPTYFPPHPVRNMSGKPLTYNVDGGLWANNPALVALSAARKVFGNNHKYMIMSFGTGDTERKIDLSQAHHWGKWGWAKSAVNMLMDASAQAVDYHLSHDPNVAYFRFQTDLKARPGDPVPSDDFDNGKPENMEALEIRGQRLYEENETTFTRLKNYFAHVDKEPIEKLLEERDKTRCRERPANMDIMDLVSG
jgi:patatin-like phospholipase/acyl hydrolase